MGLDVLKAEVVLVEAESEWADVGLDHVERKV